MIDIIVAKKILEIVLIVIVMIMVLIGLWIGFSRLKDDEDDDE